MKFTLVDYSGLSDQVGMIALARLARDDTLHVIDLPYRLSSWALDEPANVGLWVDGAGSLAAWAVMQTPFWCIDYVLRPGLENLLHPQVLDWASRRADELTGSLYGHETWYVNVFADQADCKARLERHGFANQAGKGEDAWSKVWMEWSANVEIPQYPLPAGFTIRPLAGEAEVDAYVDLHQAVFQTRNMTTEWRQRTLDQPDYLPDLDTVVVAPDGRLGAFCIGWLCPGADGVPIGQIEPLGCHADFRRYALGRIALCATLAKMQALGVKSIYVETDTYRNTATRLYEALGFRVKREVQVYARGYNDAIC